MFYPELGYEARKSIWKTLLQKVIVAGKCGDVQKEKMYGVSIPSPLPTGHIKVYWLTSFFLICLQNIH